MADQAGLTLENHHISLVVLPDHGGDLHSLTHRDRGVDVLYKPRWTPSGVPAVGGARADWLADYRGGWQVLLPNGGDDCVRDGQVWGFHGEASTVPWTVESVDQVSATLSVQLTTAPLRLRRTLTLDGATLRVDEVLENTGPEATEAMYVHHPAFGAPLIDAGARLDTGARSVVADTLMPGGGMEAGAGAGPETLGAGPGTASTGREGRSAWPVLPAGDGDVDLRRIPGPDEPRMLLAYLTDFAEPFFAITNPSLGLGVATRWSRATFPHAWIWQEIHHSVEAPWSKQEYVMAVEPATTYPAYGMNVAQERGGRGIVVAGNGQVSSTVEMTLFFPPDDFAEVSGVDWGGVVRYGG